MVIFVDLDETLIKFDSSLVFFKKILKTDFFLALKIIYAYLFKGNQVAKYIIGLHEYKFDWEISYNLELIDYLKKEHANGRKIILATGADVKIAERAIANFSFFEREIIASDEKINYVGENKLIAIKNYLKKNNLIDFEYIGDSYKDLIIWKEAAVCGISLSKSKKRLLTNLKKINSNIVVFKEF